VYGERMQRSMFHVTMPAIVAGVIVEVDGTTGVVRLVPGAGSPGGT
jgi:hypothetical protein